MDDVEPFRVRDFFGGLAEGPVVTGFAYTRVDITLAGNFGTDRFLGRQARRRFAFFQFRWTIFEFWRTFVIFNRGVKPSFFFFAGFEVDFVQRPP